MAEACGLSHMSVHRIWQAFALWALRSCSFYSNWQVSNWRGEASQKASEIAPCLEGMLA